MKKQYSVNFLTIAIAITMSAAFAFYQIPIAIGILLGSLIGVIRYMVMSSFLTSLLGIGRMNYFLFVLYFVGNFGIMAVPFYIGSIYPNFVNVFGAAFGLTLHKIVIYAREFILDRKER